MHYIRYDVLYAYVLSRLQYWSVLAQQDGDKLLKRLLNASDKERNTARKRQTAELKKAEKRKAEVDTLFAKMYEDWSAGRITEYNFNMLSEKYQNFLEHFFRNDGFVGIFHTIPFFLRLPHLFLVLE